MTLSRKRRTRSNKEKNKNFYFQGWSWGEGSVHIGLLCCPPIVLELCFSPFFLINKSWLGPSRISPRVIIYAKTLPLKKLGDP